MTLEPIHKPFIRDTRIEDAIAEKIAKRKLAQEEATEKLSSDMIGTWALTEKGEANIINDLHSYTKAEVPYSYTDPSAAGRSAAVKQWKNSTGALWIDGYRIAYQENGTWGKVADAVNDAYNAAVEKNQKAFESAKDRLMERKKELLSLYPTQIIIREDGTCAMTIKNGDTADGNWRIHIYYPYDYDNYFDIWSVYVTVINSDCKITGVGYGNMVIMWKDYEMIFKKAEK
jgi:hypothetical protein